MTTFPFHASKPPRRRPRLARPAFTLLEVTLAATLASAVAISAFSLVSMFERSDIRLANRTREAQQLWQVQLAMQRTFSAMVLADLPSVQRDQPQAEAQPEGAIEDRLSTQPRSTADMVMQQQAAQVAPRVVLSLDRGSRIDPYLLERAAAELAAKGETTARRFTATPQFLEVTLLEPPVPMSGAGASDWLAAARAFADDNAPRRETRGKREDPKDAQPEQARTLAEEKRAASQASVVRAVRGMFVLRPTADRLNGRGPARSGAMSTFLAPLETDPTKASQSWDLWWVPLPPRPKPAKIELGKRTTEAPPSWDPYEAIALNSSISPPMLVATDIAYMEWRFFRRRQRVKEYEIRFQRDIPAYAEVEVETVGGMKGNWLFEVYTLSGAETPDDEKKDPANKSGDPNSPPDSSGSPKSPGVPGSGGVKDAIRQRKGDGGDK